MIIGSYFAFGFEVSIGLILCFAVYQVGLQIFHFFNASSYFSPNIRKIRSLSVNKQDVVFLPDGRCLHNSVRWLSEYTSKDWVQKKQMRKQIGEKTLKTCEKLGVRNLFDLSKKETDEMQKNTEIIGKDIKTDADEKKYFDEAFRKNTNPTKKNPKKVEIIEGDSFDVALSLKNERKYKNVSVLNMANQTSPGGGFLQGCSAQEEALCRRSNLFDSINIYPVGRDQTNYNPYLKNKMGRRYNVPEFGAIYSPNVKIFRANQDSQGYAYFKNPQSVNIISSAAYDIAHSLTKGVHYKQNTKRKLQMILNTALENNQECVVLGAYGCGAFGNDPKEVAAIMKEILQERKVYQQKMDITFAIIKDGNDKKGNLENFSILQNT